MRQFFITIAKSFLLLLIVGAAVVTFGVTYYIQYQLPDIDALNNIQLQVPLQIYTQDGKLIAEYGEKRRIPIPYEKIPKQLIEAVLATEDQRYFQHPGIDLPGLIRASVKLALTGRKDEGGSTITMQVARTFYLTRHKTYGRKLREILLALKIDHHLSKQKILELYLNKIFLGNRAYGVAAAAQVYYGKPLNELTLDQFAMLAGLPKAPSALNPLINPEGARKRRDHVLARMYDLHYIDEDTYKKALKAPLNASYHTLKPQVRAPYVAELVRQQLEQMKGDSIYIDGLSVYTTIDSRLQKYANEAVRKNLMDYDERHGYRGREANFGKPSLKKMMDWQKKLRSIPIINKLEPAVVLEINDNNIVVMRNNGTFATVPWEGLSWARKQIDSDFLGRLPRSADEIVKLGDVIRITQQDSKWRLTQIPKAEASIVALNPQNGGILALIGGFDFQNSNFNRVTSAVRQPGSSFKPFIYSAALDKGYTLATVINDAPIVIENPIDNTLWRPQNDTHRFYGPTRLREALIHSRNLVSIRLLDLIGTDYAVNYIERFGFNKSQLPPTLSLALGTASVTPLDMAAGYAVFANGGFKVTPYIIERIQSPQNSIVYEAKPLLPCPSCDDRIEMPIVEEGKPTELTHAPRVISPQNTFLIDSALHDVIQHGTAISALSLKRSDLAGKTGTTNNQFDAWFAGFNPDIVAITWVGFDQPRSLHEYGAQAALPMWISFMKDALKNKPEHTLYQPAGVVSVRIDPATGARASADDSEGVFEYFMEPYLPGDQADYYGPAYNEEADKPSYNDNDGGGQLNQAAPNAGIY